jgi:hypothetical protein
VVKITSGDTGIVSIEVNGDTAVVFPEWQTLISSLIALIKEDAVESKSGSICYLVRNAISGTMKRGINSVLDEI